MRILFVIPSLAGGGAERVVAMLASQLAVDHHVKIVTFGPERGYEAPVEVENIDFPAYTRRPSGWLPLLPRSIARLARSAASYRADVCVSFMVYPNLLNIVARAFHRRPAVLSVRTMLSQALPESRLQSRLARAAIRVCFPAADAIVAISEGVRRDLIDEFALAPGSIRTIRNPIEMSRVQALSLRPLPPEFAFLASYRVMINVARLVPEKGQWSLIRSFSLVRQSVSDARLLIVGAGPLHDYLVDVACAQGLRVWSPESGASPDPDAYDLFMMGRISDPFNFIRAARLFVFPSVLEGLGNVLLESLAVNTLVLSADCRSGPREILAPELEGPSIASRYDGPYGVLMPPFPPVMSSPRDPLTDLEASWAAVMTALLEQEAKPCAQSEAGALRASEFSVEKIAEEWCSCLEALAPKPRGSYGFRR